MAGRNISANLILQLQQWAQGWRNAAQQGQRALQQMQNGTRSFGSQAQASAKGAQGAFSRFFSGAGGGIRSVIGNVAQMTLAFAGAQAAIAGMTSAFRGLIGGLVGFESTLEKTVGLTSLEREEVDKVKGALTALAKEVGRSPNELADAFYFAVSALGDTDKALATVEVSSRAAAAGLGETKVVADAVSSAMNAYQMSASEASRVTDILVSTVKAGKMAPEDLAGALGRVLPAAAQLNVPLEEVGANVATLTRIGLSSEEAVVALRGTLMALIKPSTQAREALKEMGTSAAELRRMAGEEGLAATLAYLMEVTHGDEEALATLIPNVRALTGVLGTAGAQGETYKKILQDINNEVGISAEAFEGYTHTFEYQWNRFKATAQAAFFDFAYKFLPVASGALEAFLNFIKSKFDLSILRQELVERFGIDIQGIIPILETFKSGLIGLGEIIGRVISFLREHREAAIAVGIALVALFAWMHPLAAAILGVILVVGWLRDHWDMLGQKIEWLRDVIHRNFGWIEAYVRMVWSVIYANIEAAINQVRNIVNLVMAVLQGDWGAAWDALKSIVTDAFDHLKSVAMAFGQGFVGIFSGIWKSLAWGAAQALNWIIDRLNDFLGKISQATGWLKKVPGIGKLVEKIPTAIPHVPVPEFDFGGFGGGPGLTGEGRAEVARMRRYADDYQEMLDTRAATEQAGFDAEIARMLDMADSMAEAQDGLVGPTEDAEAAAGKAARSAKDTADKLDTAANTIGKAVEKFVDPIEQAFRQFYWAWRKSGLMWEDFVRRAFVQGVPKLQRGVARFAGGLAVVGEHGPELLRIPAGAGVAGTAETARMLSGGVGARTQQQIMNEFNIAVTGDRWEAIRVRVMQFLDEAAAEAGLRSPLTQGGVGMPRL